MAGYVNENKVKIIYIKIMLLLSGGLCVCAEGDRKVCHNIACFESGDTQAYMTLDDDGICYADFKQRLFLWDYKIPKPLRDRITYANANNAKTECNHDIREIKSDPSVKKTKDPPDVMIYSRDEVIIDEENTLICFVNNFFPPVINITWAKNDEKVKEEAPFIKTISNSDGTFHVFSYLKVTAHQGDIYKCSVEHETLDEPNTRIWVVEAVKAEEESSGPAVFCGLGVTLGLLGVAAGTVFFMKGKRCQDAG